MKIGILTQALHGNYGGILQNYALQQVLKQLGHNPVTIDRHLNLHDSVLKGFAKQLARLRYPFFDSSQLTSSEKVELSDLPLKFVGHYINRIGPLYSQEDFDNVVSDNSFDAFIVGSDQCWRPRYSANINNYFLDFAVSRPVKRIAYAASFGVDKWEYNADQTIVAGKSAGKMNAISVREESGIALCQKHLGINPKWVLDPTMLLGGDGFQQFVKKHERESSVIAKYLLEASALEEDITKKAKEIYGTDCVIDNNISKSFKRFSSVKHYKKISVEDWISNIANSKFFITDSFHGTVFAIMFNVPFVVVLNQTRGNTRIESLLMDFGLSDCIVNSANFEIPSIDWTIVNEHLKVRKSESLEFLYNALS